MQVKDSPSNSRASSTSRNESRPTPKAETRTAVNERPLRNGHSSSARIISSQDQVNVSAEAQGPADRASSVNELVAGMNSWNESAANGSGAVEADAELTETPPPSELNLASGELLGQGRNSDPERVTQLQQMLSQRGMSLEVDGAFGPRTAEAVRSFQEENGLSVDGIVGPQTLAALNGSQTQTDAQPEGAETEEVTGQIGAAEAQTPGAMGQLSLADPNLSPAEQYEHYREIVEANGGEIRSHGATVIGLRGLGTDGDRHAGNSNLGGYDDTFVVLNRDASGQPTVQTFEGATHANQRSSSASYGPDRNGNTVRGVAMLAPGNYNVDPASRNYRGSRGPSFSVETLNGNSMVPAFRDLDADGTISAQERASAERGGYEASAILFHAGNSSAPSSIGCQTLPPALMQAFSDAVGFQQFNYTLLDANQSRIPQ